MIYAEVLAGGKGTRMGNTDMPKQFLMLGDKPVFIHTLEQFILNSRIEKVLVCCPKQWISHTKDTVKKYIRDISKIVVVEGGASRNDTIMNGCRYIENTFGLNHDDIVVTHDAVRPFVTQRIIDENIDAALKFGATDTVVEAFDTIVESNDGKIIKSIPLRSHMFQGQTPQSFNIQGLKDLFASISEEEAQILTDACKAFVIKGHKVHLVQGEVYNMKITTQHDLKIANALVGKRG